jgi:hypothetical protein
VIYPLLDLMVLASGITLIFSVDDPEVTSFGKE